MLTRRLDELLLAEGVVDEQSLSLARTEALARQRKLAELVIDLGLIDQRSLAELLARESRTEVVSPIDTKSIRALAPMVPAFVARRHQVVPVRHDADGLVVAMIDPSEPGIVELIESAAGVPVRRAVGVRSEIEMAVLDLYHIEDDADRTIHVTSTLALELGPGSAELEGEYLGIPDEWQTSMEQSGNVVEAAPAPKGGTDADRTAPSSGGRLTEGERLAHLERQLINVSKVLAIIQSRLDTIDARLANLASQVRATK